MVNLPWIAVAAASTLLAACPESSEPSADAVQNYLLREGLAVAAADATPTVTVTPTARRVQVTVVSGRDLPDTDAGPGVTDPYVVVEYDGTRFETSVVEGSQQPTWGDSYVFDVRPGAVLSISLMDEDALASDDKMGVVSQAIPALKVGESITLDVAFRNGEMGIVTLTLAGIPEG